MLYSETFQSFLGEIREFYHKNDGDVWFRGHGHKNYKLIPGIYRGLNGINRSDLIKETLIHERSMFLEFIDMGGLLSNEENWNNLFKMQHYGAPTRLLDWTESLGAALFFATEKWNNADNEPHIWMMNPKHLNKLALKRDQILSLSVDHSEKYFEALDRMVTFLSDIGRVTLRLPEYPHIGLRTTHAVFPKFNNPRIQAQSGRFTVHGVLPTPIEEDSWPRDPEKSDIELVKLESIDALKKIKIPWVIREEVQEYLKMNDIDAFTIYPDLTGLGQKLKLKYEANVKQLLKELE